MQWSWFKIASPRQKIGLVLISLGLFFFLGAFSFKAYQDYRQNILSFSQLPELQVEADEELLPEKIIIPSVGIDLVVSPARVENSLWQVSKEGASYLWGSGIPGREGNVVIYGHNTNRLFGPIRWLKTEAEIKVINRKGEEFVYKIVETKTVSPDSVEVLSPTEEAILTLYTCTGFWDSQRYVVRARLQPEAQ
jgi:LPXTG-site transpeptidase (sortase) family protein